MHLLGRPGEITAAELALVTGGTEAPYSPYGVHLEPGSGDIGELDVVREGLAVVQDEGSQLVALAAVAGPADRRATAAAGWTCAPARAARRCCSARWPRWTAAPLDAVEISEHRADLVRRAVDGLPVTVHLADGRDAPLPAGAFDRVLVDAPCTGPGRPAAPARGALAARPDDVSGLTKLQRELLSAGPAARPARAGSWPT